MLAQHIRPGHQPHDHKCTEKNRHGSAPRHAEGDGRYEIAAFFRIVRRSRSQYAAYIAFAEALPVLGISCALHRVSVRHPLRHAPTRSRHDTDKNSHGRTTNYEPKMAKGIFDAFHDPPPQVFRRPITRDRSAP